MRSLEEMIRDMKVTMRLSLVAYRRGVPVNKFVHEAIVQKMTITGNSARLEDLM